MSDGPSDTGVPSGLGLSSIEAAGRLAAEGPNELPSTKSRGIFRIAAEVVREPMLLLLVGCGAVYLALGDIREALLLMTFVLVVIAITFYQERKTERALEALRDLSSPRALVVRDGVDRRIPGRGVVRGDAVLLSEGDRVPADGVLAACSNLTVDESLLTGESVPVRKQPAAVIESVKIGRPGGEGTPFVYSGTLAVSGRGVMVVARTGPATEMGGIGAALTSLRTERTPLQREVGRLVRLLALFGLGLCALVVVVYGATRADWLNGLLAGITLAMALLPEEFPVVLTIFLALGAWRLSQRQVLTRRMPAVETLGSVTVLCVDKTGTLTQNRMSVVRLDAGGTSLDVDHPEVRLPEAFHELVEFAILASDENPFDPMEIAIRGFGVAALGRTEHVHRDWKLVAEYPLSDSLLALSHVWRTAGGEQRVVATKGAPEAVTDLCHMSEDEREDVRRRVLGLAEDGLRVLGVASAVVRGEASLPPGQHDFTFEFLGLVGLADPVRPGVASAVQDCHDAGIHVVMITGDYPGTALSIAGQIGLADGRAVITGPQLDAMDDEELAARILTTPIFARTVPEQKLRLVRALKASDQVVAMTGDGVNDAPALKAADIGIAMGGRGTDVAREAAALVVTDDDFSSIVSGVRMGRRIYDNLKKAMAYVLAVHVPIAGLSFIPVLFGSPLVLAPVHIAFLELIIDPVCSVVFEAEREEADVMRRRPRRSGEPLFGRRILAVSLLQGLGVLLVVLLVYLASLARGADPGETRALTFTSLVVANLALILTNLSWSRPMIAAFHRGNTALWAVLGTTTVAMAGLLLVPGLRSLFQFAPLDALDVLIAAAAGLASVLWFEAFKLVVTHRAGDTA